MKTTNLYILCLVLAITPAHAQSTPDSIVQITAEAQGLTVVPPDQLPRFGTYWLIMPGGRGGCISVPMPLPKPGSRTYEAANGQFIVDAVGTEPVDPQTLEAQATSIVNLINQIQETQAVSQMRTAMGLGDLPGFGGGDGSGSRIAMNNARFSIDTNLLWLQITNVSEGTVCANLYNATDQVYAVWSTTNLALPHNLWLVEAELQQPNTNCQPFTVAQLGRQDLFLLAEDWTGVTENGNQTPNWWLFKYYGMAGLGMSDTNTDDLGNPLIYDFLAGRNPLAAGAVPDMNGDVNLQIYTPLQ